MTAAERKRAALKAIRAARKRRGLQKDLHAEQVIASLAEVHAWLSTKLKTTESPFDRSTLPALLEELDARFDQWVLIASGDLSAGMAAALEEGPRILDDALRAVGRPVPGLLIPDGLLEELTADGVEYLQNVNAYGKERIRSFLRNGVTGGLSTDDLVVGIGETVSSPGKFKHIAYRGEVIMRDQLGRMHSRAGHLRMTSALDVIPDLMKRWIHSGKSRSEHKAVHGQVRPVNEPFDVAGEQLRFPRDPEASLENTILCGCEHVPHLDSW